MVYTTKTSQTLKYDVQTDLNFPVGRFYSFPRARRVGQQDLQGSKRLSDAGHIVQRALEGRVSPRRRRRARVVAVPGWVKNKNTGGGDLL